MGFWNYAKLSFKKFTILCREDGWNKSIGHLIMPGGEKGVLYFSDRM
jgi:hypothetical protein